MANEHIRKTYAGAVAPTALSASVSSGAVALPVVDCSTYPTGSVGPFVVRLSAGLAVEEKVLCSGKIGSTQLTVIERGYDGTTASAHSSGATVTHCLDAHSLDQVNAFVNLPTTKGEIPVQGTSDWTLITPGTEGQLLAMGAVSVPGWINPGIVTAAVEADITAIEAAAVTLAGRVTVNEADITALEAEIENWTTYVPTWTNVTAGNGTYAGCRFRRVGQSIEVRGKFTLGSTSAVSGNAIQDVPDSATIESGFTPFGQCAMGDATTTVTNLGVVGAASSTTVALYLISASNPYATVALTDATTPFTWAVNDTMAWHYTARLA